MADEARERDQARGDTAAPDFELTAHSGEAIRLSARRGAPVVLYFLRAFT